MEQYRIGFRGISNTLMDKAFGSSAVAVMPALSTKKASARVALIEMKEAERILLAECFRQFGVESVALT